MNLLPFGRKNVEIDGYSSVIFNGEAMSAIPGMRPLSIDPKLPNNRIEFRHVTTGQSKHSPLLGGFDQRILQEISGTMVVIFDDDIANVTPYVNQFRFNEYQENLEVWRVVELLKLRRLGESVSIICSESVRKIAEATLDSILSTSHARIEQ